MKKVMAQILKWLFLILFLAGVVFGFLMTRNMATDLRGVDFQERTISL